MKILITTDDGEVLEIVTAVELVSDLDIQHEVARVGLNKVVKDVHECVDSSIHQAVTVLLARSKP